MRAGLLFQLIVQAKHGAIKKVIQRIILIETDMKIGGASGKEGVVGGRRQGTPYRRDCQEISIVGGRRESFDHVPQLTYIPRPEVAAQGIDRSLFKVMLLFTAHALFGATQEIFD